MGLISSDYNMWAYHEREYTNVRFQDLGGTFTTFPTMDYESTTYTLTVGEFALFDHQGKKISSDADTDFVLDTGGSVAYLVIRSLQNDDENFLEFVAQTQAEYDADAYPEYRVLLAKVNVSGSSVSIEDSGPIQLSSFGGITADADGNVRLGAGGNLDLVGDDIVSLVSANITGVTGQYVYLQASNSIQLASASGTTVVNSIPDLIVSTNSDFIRLDAGNSKTCAIRYDATLDSNMMYLGCEVSSEMAYDYARPLNVIGEKSGFAFGSASVAMLENNAAASSLYRMVLDLVLHGTTDSDDRFLSCINNVGTELAYIDGTGAYGPFTGAHDSFNADRSNWLNGMIVVSTGEIIGTPTISNALPYVTISTERNQKAVMGVYKTSAKAKALDDKFNYNALGEGLILVSTIDGDIELGDYITTSDIPGYGSRQDDDILHNYTVAKCTQHIDWSTVYEHVMHNDVQYKVALIACTYHCG